MISVLVDVFRSENIRQILEIVDATMHAKRGATTGHQKIDKGEFRHHEVE